MAWWQGRATAMAVDEAKFAAKQGSVNEMDSYLNLDNHFRRLRNLGITYKQLFTKEFGMFELYPRGVQRIWVNDRMRALKGELEQNSGAVTSHRPSR